MIGSIFSFLFVIAVVAAPFVITALKKKKQIGDLWSGPLSAAVIIQDIPLTCSHCQSTKFQKREGILVTSWVALFRFEFWNQSAACYSCMKCGHIEWFVRPKDRVVEFERREIK